MKWNYKDVHICVFLIKIQKNVNFRIGQNRYAKIDIKMNECKLIFSFCLSFSFSSGLSDGFESWPSYTIDSR